MHLKKVILNYPYHKLDKASTQSLIGFPLYLNSSFWEVSTFSELKSPRHADGFVQAYNLFIEYLSEENFDSLEGLVEWNMIQRLKIAWLKYKSLGYSMKLIGSPDSSRCFTITNDVYIGSIIPLRNLNFPSEYYDIFTETMSTTAVNTVEYFRLKNLKLKDLSFEEFMLMNLVGINNEYLQGKYYNEILRIISLMNIYKIKAEASDIGIVTNYKVVVVDSMGNVVEGGNNGDNEFHCLRFEYARTFFPWISRFTGQGRSALRFAATKLQSVLFQYTIIDVDGFMNKNLIIPR